MSKGGFSAQRLARMHNIMVAYVERGDVPGLITALSRRGETQVDVVGSKALGGADPLRRDTIFRIASLTKPVTAVAAMILVEECRLRLDEPLDTLLPELANRRVLQRYDGPLNETVPANRPLTLRDLLTMRLGFGMGDFAMLSADYPIVRAARELELQTLSGPKPATPLTPDEWLRRFGQLPLMYQPGERWLYNTGMHILSVLIPRASGQSLESFMRERIFAPLGMPDTGFTVPDDKLERLATAYMAQPDGSLKPDDDVENSQWRRPPDFPDGAAGLVSTVDDFLAFGQMMLEMGKYPGGRLLSRLSVAAMTTDQLTPAQKAVSGFYPGYFDSLGWGLGMSVVTKRDAVAGSVGRFGWDGGSGTSWYSDPREEMVAILLTQRGAFPQQSSVYLDFWTAAYQAIDD